MLKKQGGASRRDHTRAINGLSGDFFGFMSQYNRFVQAVAVDLNDLRASVEALEGAAPQATERPTQDAVIAPAQAGA